MSTAAEARAAAAAAAEAAGVEVFPATALSELDEVRGMVNTIWGGEVVPPRNLLRGMAVGGACLLLARRGGRPVGFALAFLGWERGVHLHSHQVGVVDDLRGAGVGLALKLAQRAECLEHDITEMRWTFDPMLLANARFNLVRLGATVVDFLPDCYGRRVDAFNTGDTTDRLEVSWRLDVPVGGAMLHPAPGDAVVEVPARYHELRTTDLAAAAAARVRVGAALGTAVAEGRGVRGVCAAGYVLEGR
jgi:predicted GNAT superfamily acetyltransferase